MKIKIKSGVLWCFNCCIAVKSFAAWSELTGKLSWNSDVESVLSKGMVQFYTERKYCTSPNTAEISKNPLQLESLLEEPFNV